MFSGRVEVEKGLYRWGRFLGAGRWGIGRRRVRLLANTGCEKRSDFNQRYCSTR